MTANKLDGSRGTAGGSTDIDDFGRSNKKLSQSRKSTISSNSGAIKKTRFLISGAKKAFNLLLQAFTKIPIL